MQTAGAGSSAPLPVLPRIALAAGPVILAAVLVTRATIPNIPTWYAGLAKPPYTPPNWLFGPAWSVLYGLMALAVLIVLSRPPGTPGRRAALVAFFAQLALNAAWSWAFFAGQSPTAGLGVILALDVALVWTIVCFGAVSRPAALLLAPYLAWVLFATYLTAGIWTLNT